MISGKDKRKLKFLYISSDKFPPFRVDVAVLFGKELANRGHQIDYLMQSETDNRTFFSTDYSGGSAFVGATDNGVGFVNRLYKHCLSILNDLRAVRLSKIKKYDFIQVKDKFLVAILAILLAKWTRSKFFFWLSFPFPEADIYEYKTGSARYPLLYHIRGNSVKLMLYKIIMPLADHVFVQSDQMKEDIIEQGVDPEKITPVPMGVDLDDISVAEGSNDKQIKRESLAVLYLGTMQKIRKIDFVIKVFRKVLDEIPDAVLYMVGGSENPADLELLKADAKRLGVEHATVFTDNLPRKEALEYIKKAAVGLSPFLPTPILNSTSPTKLIEYMSLGLPAVANDHPEQRQVLDESKAGICVPYNEDAFAAAIIKILKKPEESVAMGIKGEEYILNHRNYGKIADGLEKKYYTLTS